MDKYTFRREWQTFIDETGEDLPIDLVSPGQNDFLGILQDVPDSVEHIMAVVRWAWFDSNHWFKKPKGRIPDSTALRNAYPEMARQYKKYQNKGARA